MKALHLTRFDAPGEAVVWVGLESPPPPAANEVQIAVTYSPIHPSDLLMIRGFYGIRPALPAVLGSEGVGRVIAEGECVSHLLAGDKVLVPCMASACQERLNVDAAALFALPEQADEQQLAMLEINPATSHLLLTEFTALVVDGPDLPKRMAQATGKAPIKLGLDAVGGVATANLAGSLASGAVTVAYAAMSGQAAQVGPRETIFRDVSLRGFWLANWAKRSTAAQRAELYRQLVPLVSEGVLTVPIVRIAKPEQAGDALAQAERHQGKVLFAFADAA